MFLSETLFLQDFRMVIMSYCKLNLKHKLIYVHLLLLFVIYHKMKTFFRYHILVQLEDLGFGDNHRQGKYTNNIKTSETSPLNLGIDIKDVVTTLFNMIWKNSSSYNEQLAENFGAICLFSGKYF